CPGGRRGLSPSRLRPQRAEAASQRSSFSSHGARVGMTHGRRWDIFCNVVDNFGDIGVSWRLARQLAAEHGLVARLWVDDLASLARLCPQVDAHMPSQFMSGVQVRRWERPFVVEVTAGEVADVVVEAFGCELPEAYVEAMARREP